MASGETTTYDLPFPVPSDQVNVAGDIQALAERIDIVLPTIGLPLFSLEVTNNSGASITKGSPVYISGYDAVSGKTEITKSQASDITTFPIAGLAQTAIGNGSDGVIVLSGVFNGIDTSSFAVGDLLYVGTSGGLTATQPISETTNSGVVGVVSKSNVSGTILVGAAKGNGTWGSMKAGLA